MTRFLIIAATIAAFLCPGSRLAAQTNTNYPAWWTNYGVLSGSPPNDYAGVNQG